MKALLFSISFLIILAIPLSNIFAANYYVSQEKGNDNRSLSEAQNPDTPWKSIAKVNSLFNYLKPGDAILFNRGETFYGTLHISSSGSSSAPIKIGAYGSGAKPVITSLITVSNWRSIGNGIYESNTTINTNTVQVLLINGEAHELGRYPNIDQANEGYLNIDDVGGNSLLSSNELGGSPNWNDGEIVIKKNQWIIDTHQISSHSGSQIRFNGKISAYTAQEDYGFFIQNHIQTLDTFGEWYFNPSTKKINVYFGNSNPSSLKVEVSTLDNLIIKDYRDANISIENINFKGANKSAVTLEGGNNIKISDSEINYSGENGILALEVLDLLVERNNINSTYNNGMYLRYGNDNAIIRDNEINKTALIPGRTQNEDAAGIGIFASGENVLIQNNNVINSGFNGIQFNGNYSIVKNNFVDKFCQIKGDGGGIYTFGGVQYQGYKGRKIQGNIVINSMGSEGGIPDKGINYKPLAEGIFLDDHSNNIEITGNTVGNIRNSGLKMSNANTVKVYGNTFFNASASITLGNSDIGENTRNITIEDNQFFSRNTDQRSYAVKTYKNDIIEMADFDKNYFFRPFGDEFSIENQYYKNGETYSAMDDLEQWKNKFGKDINSKSNTIDIATYSITKKIGDLLYENAAFNDNTKGVSCNNCSQSWDSNNKLDGGSIKISSTVKSSLKINLGRLQKSKTYLLRFKAIANKEGNIQAYLRYTGSPWEQLSAMSTFSLNTQVSNNEVLISPYVDADEVSLMIAVNEENFTYWMDDLELVEVEASFINPDDEILFEYNPTKNSKTIVLPGEYVNAKLERFSGKVTIPAYGSLVLLRVSNDIQTEKDEVIEKIPETTEGKYFHFGNNGPINYHGNVFEKLNNEYLLSTGTNVSSNENGSDEQLFQEARFNNELLFKIPVENGTYTIKTYHNELYFGQNGKSQEAGQRVFDIALEGKVVKEDLDLYIENKNQEVILTFKEIEVKDGFLNLDLKASSNNALISAVAILLESNEIVQQPGIALSIKEDISKIEEGDQLTLVSEITNLDNNIEKVEFYCGLKLVGTCSEKPFLAVVDEIPSGENYVWAAVTDKNGNVNYSSEIEFTVNEKIVEEIESKPVENGSDQTFEGIFYHVGYTGTINYNGQEFQGMDRGFIVSNGSNISNNQEASNEELFQSGRFEDKLSFEIPLENGIYTIQTYHNEVYFGKSGRYEKAGQRVFDISIEGDLVKDNLDLYLENNNQETILTFNTIEVTDGLLNLDLIAATNNSIISGIGIIPLSAESPIYTDESDGIEMHINTSYTEAVVFKETSYEPGSDYFNTSASNTYSNSNASNDKIFQSERYAKQLSFDIPVENGTYTVKTYHNELYFGKGGSSAKQGRRVYNILLENKVVADNFDIYVHNNNQQTILTFEDVQVNDGVLNLDLEAIVNNASISGISIIQEGKDSQQQTSGSEHLFFLNTGSDADATLNGITYLAEAKTEQFYSDNTGRYNNTGADVETLFQTERSGKNLVYTVPVPNGTYTVFTMHNEVWFGYEGGTAKAGKRVYDISIQGDVLKEDFDLFLENSNEPTILSFEDIEVTNGVLTLELTASVNNANISGFAIIGDAAKSTEIATNLRTAQNSFNRGYKEMYNRGYKEMELETETIDKDEIRIFPNPAKGRATLELNAEIGQGRVIIHNMNGQLVSHFDLESIKTANNQFNVPLDNLSQGIYLVSVSNEQTIINKQRLIVNP
ncbi:malectin domain-containing carbohydrate-binding protein [Cyclobacterium sp. 1_MG-2023]|uniref:malectin domain-containing carbohydrate-binding protein n=1 Tax=Cyclobacterium sp. 1_MG-2023 TaxID=3062681 RepID=UPI0026E2E71B|nr:malectin domain-containing carbohydrate-binding protein [Cyclobacterium sp. 1_MG-2023]MDO6439492.1 malectin domain-containing carbohydrate-binding protein [Cyclobacterium sp. 1_MG-2023]